jgi:radical SAM protein with 4Fe4S-binding SPASM domain
LLSNSKHLRLDHIQDILQQISPKRVSLFGFGEPFMHPDILGMVEYAKNRKCAIDITTNGTSLTPQQCERIVRSDLDILRISLDGATSETFHAIRGTARFNHIVDGIRTLVETRKRYNSCKPGIRLLYVIVKENYHEMAQMVQLAHELGVDAINFYPLELIGIEERREALLGNVFYEDVLQQIASALETQQTYSLSTNLRTIYHNFPHYWERYRTDGNSHDYGVCILPWYFAYISVEGDVYPCCSFLRQNQGLSMGNLLQTPIQEIWNGEQYANLRRTLRQGGFYSSLCRHCMVRKTFADVLNDLWGLVRGQVIRRIGMSGEKCDE